MLPSALARRILLGDPAYRVLSSTIECRGVDSHAGVQLLETDAHLLSQRLSRLEQAKCLRQDVALS